MSSLRRRARATRDRVTNLLGRVWDRLDRLGGWPVVLVAVGVYGVLNAVLTFGAFQYVKDGIENLDLVRNLANGKGFISTFRTFYWGPEGFPQPPQLVRAILYPLLAGGAYTLVPAPRTLQVLNIVIGAASLALLYAILARRFEKPVATVSILLIATSTKFGAETTRPLSEPISLFALLAAIAVADHRGTAPFRHFVLGLWIGVAYLARPSTMLMGAALALYSWFFRQRDARRPPWVRSILATALGASVAVFPLWLLNVRFHLPLWYSPASFASSVLTFRDLMQHGFFFKPPGAVNLVLAHPIAVVKQILLHTIMHGRGLFLDPLELGFLAFFWLALWRWFRERRGTDQVRFAALLATLAALNLLTNSLVWSVYADRYRLVSFVLLLPLLILGLRSLCQRLNPRPTRIYWPLGGLLFILFANLSIFNNTVEVLPSLRGGPVADWYSHDDGVAAIQAARWLKPRVAPNCAVAATDSWTFMYWLGRPTLLLPSALSPQELEEFLRTYRVRAVVNLEGERSYKGFGAGEGTAGLPPQVIEKGIHDLDGSATVVRFGRNAVYLLEDC